jgi:hypothetical protein
MKHFIHKIIHGLLVTTQSVIRRKKICKGKGKGKGFSLHTTKAYRGSRGTAPLILSIRMWRAVNCTSWPLYAREKTALNRRLGVPQSQAGHFGEEKSLLSLPGFEPWTVQPVA